jgi:ParB/RepB/Spo0J family partition protein
MSTTTTEVILYPVDLIDPSPYQVRTHFDETSLAELAKSIQEHGIIQPLTARVSPTDPSRLELVAGERRLRAARLAGQPTAPVIVHELNDRDAQEIVLIENLQREDLTVSEEARGYQKALDLRDDEGRQLYTQETLANKIGKPLSHVRDRLKLLLCPATLVEAVEAGVVAISVAMLVGRIPDLSAREKAAKKVLKPDIQEVPLNYAQTREMIREHFMVSLKNCGFDPEDEGLVPLVVIEGQRIKGGSCQDCPYRSGNCTEGAVAAPAKNDKGGRVRGGTAGADPDLCTMPSCWKEKQDAAWKIIRARSEEQNVKVIEGDAARRLFNGNELAWNSTYVQLDRKPMYGDIPNYHENQKPWNSLLKGKDIPLVVARHPVTGRRVELAPKKAAQEAARAAVKEIKAEKAKNAPLTAKAIEERCQLQISKAKNKARNETTLNATRALLNELMRPFDRLMWIHFFNATVRNYTKDDEEFLCRVLDPDAGKIENAEKRLMELVEAVPTEQLPGLIVLANHSKGIRVNGWWTVESDHSGMKDYCKHLQFDPKLWAKAISNAEKEAEKTTKAAMLEKAKGERKKEEKAAKPAVQAKSTSKTVRGGKVVQETFDLSNGEKRTYGHAGITEALMERARQWKADNPKSGAAAMADDFGIDIDLALAVSDALVDEKYDAKPKAGDGPTDEQRKYYQTALQKNGKAPTTAQFQKKFKIGYIEADRLMRALDEEQPSIFAEAGEDWGYYCDDCSNICLVEASAIPHVEAMQVGEFQCVQCAKSPEDGFDLLPPDQVKLYEPETSLLEAVGGDDDEDTGAHVDA